MPAFAVFLLPLGVIVCGVVLIVVVVVVRARGRRQRADAPREWAVRHGWGFVPHDDDVGWARPCWPRQRRWGRACGHDQEHLRQVSIRSDGVACS